jgi:hypothetical protein
MWADRIWPFSAFNRIERKIDTMTSKAEQLKTALDAIGGHLTGIKSGVDAIQANLQAAVDGGNADPMLDAALSEANDLAEKTAAMEAALAPHATIPQAPSPTPASASARDDSEEQSPIAPENTEDAPRRDLTPSGAAANEPAVLDQGAATAGPAATTDQAKDPDAAAAAT